MGTWGTGLSSNDIFADIYGEFFELYNEGKDVGEITNKLLRTNQSLFHDKGDSNNFWFAIAKAQWECKALDKDVYNKVKSIIESEENLTVWRELGADQREVRKRNEILQKFLVQLGQERQKPKPRKKKKIFKPAFEKGICLTFNLLSGNFGAAVILEAIDDNPYGLNLVVVTDLNMKEKPTVGDIIKSNVLKLNYASWDKEVQVGWLLANHFKKDSGRFEVIDKIEISRVYTYNVDSFSVSGDWFIWIIEVASRQFDEGRNTLFGFGTKTRKFL